VTVIAPRPERTDWGQRRRADLERRPPEGLRSAVDPAPRLLAAVDRVARDFDVPSDWLNSGPAELLRLGLPTGFEDPWETRSYGESLRVRWASRFDQIHFKLYAAVDQAGNIFRISRPCAQPAKSRWPRRVGPVITTHPGVSSAR
jgi:hypothetical protein